MIQLTDFRNLLRGGLLLETSAFEDLRDDPDGFARGLQFLVAVALIVGLVLGTYGFVTSWNASASTSISKAEQGVNQVLEQMEQMGALGGGELDDVTANIREGFGVAAEVGEVVDDTTSAPLVAVRFLEALAKVLSQPFGWIALWLTWGVITLVFARVLGGSATVQQMLATTSLVAAPHILDALGFVPCGGVLFQAIAFFWGLFVYVKATAVANRFDAVWLGALAAFAPILVLLLLALAGAVIVGAAVSLAN
jgi:hypothetical protein